LKAVEKWGVGSKVVREVMEGNERTKVKFTYNGHTLRHPFENQLKY
jgi:predicted HTH transcriptional regulator